MVEGRVDDLEDTVQSHDRRITRNENWRLQAQGALKVLAIIVGAGGLTYLTQLL